MTIQTLPLGRSTTSAVSTGERSVDWRLRSACRDEDPELFFPIGYGAQARLQREEAKEVCAGCPVRVECRKWALDTGQGAGVWGGLDETERAAMVRPMTVTAIDWCIGHQELIEKRRTDGVSWRVLAAELGVRADTVRRAVKVFEADRAQLDAAFEAVSA